MGCPLWLWTEEKKNVSRFAAESESEAGIISKLMAAEKQPYAGLVLKKSVEKKTSELWAKYMISTLLRRKGGQTHRSWVVTHGHS